MEHNVKYEGPAEKNNSKVPDTQLCKTEKLSNGLKNSTSDHGRRNIDEPTAVSEDDEIANGKKIAALVRKVLHNEIPDEKMEWPLCLLMESDRSVEISQQELQNMILNKSAEVMATHGQSRIAKEMANMSVCKEQQRAYYKKYKELSNYVNTVSSELDLLKRLPDNEVAHVRHVGTYVKMPAKKKEL